MVKSGVAIRKKEVEDMKNLYRQVILHLQNLKVNAEMEEPGCLGFDINMEHAMVGVRIICDETEKRVMLFGESTYSIPPAKYQEVLTKINHIHQNEYNSAHLFLNCENNHLMSQVVLNADSNNHVDYDVFRFALCDVCYIQDSYYNEIVKLLVGVDPARIAIGKPKKNRLTR